MDYIYGFVLTSLLVYNNSLVLLGPTAWGTGLGARRAVAVAVAAQLLGTYTSTLSQIRVGTPEFLYVATLYVFLSLAKISLPISVLSYSIHSPRPEAFALWMASPAASALTYPLCKLLRGGTALSALSLFVAMYAFGYNNIAIFAYNPLTTAAAVVLGTYFGAGLSRWVLEIAALRPRTTAAINLTVATAALIGTIFATPMSFTLVAYSAMLVASYSQQIRVIKIEKFAKAYLGILIAVAASLIFPALKPLLAPPA